MRKVAFFVLLITALVAGIFFVGVKPGSLNKVDVADQVSVIVSPFGSKNILGIWQGETAPFMNAIENESDVSSLIPLCEKGYTGFIHKQPVLVAVSGIGKVKTTACMTNIMQVYQNRIKEVILSGIGGISADRGTAIGDICINSISADYDLQYYGADQALIREAKPEFWSSDDPNPASRLYTDTILARELYTASGSINPSFKVWGPSECLEISGDLFWHDVRSDLQARTIAADLLKIRPEDAVIITSMEAIAAGNVISWWNNAYKTKINFAYVRGASNFDHVSLDGNGLPLKDAKESWESGMNNEFVEKAIRNAAMPVLKMFELRDSLKF